jgi:hypothetical protein
MVSGMCFFFAVGRMLSEQPSSRHRRRRRYPVVAMPHAVFAHTVAPTVMARSPTQRNTMNLSRFKLNPILFALSGSLMLLSACGGGGGDNPSPPASTTVSGVAASDGPLAGAAVTLVDSDAATANPAAATTGSDGSYSLVVDGMKPPFSLRVVYTRDGVSKTLYSLLPSTSANVSNTANITPLTDAVAVLVAPGGNPSVLTDASLSAALTGTNANAFSNAVATLNAVLASDPTIGATLAAAAGTGNTFNPVTTTFAANGTGVDGVLNRLTVTTNPPGSASGTVQIQNNAQAVTGTGPAAPITITAATTPATAPTLPPTASGDLPAAADLDAVAKAFNDCYALPATQRVTAIDASGNATAIATACDFAVADYKSNGYTWIQSQADNLANANLNGAVWQRPVIALVQPAANRTGAKEFKHPYCDQSQCVLVDIRGTMPAANGQTFQRDVLLAKTGTGWKLVGNQRQYDFDIQLRLSRHVNQNAAPLSPTNYFSISRFEGILRLQLNPSGPGMNGVRAARVSGPGLPALGVVLSRSSRCTSDRMPIVSKTGNTFVVDNGVNVPRYWTGNAGNDFKIAAANLDGSVPAAWPSANVDYADSLSASDEVVAYGQYKWEFFNFDSATPAEPDLITYQRLIVSNPDLNPPVDFPALWWPTLASADINDYLKPTGSKAGALTDVALSWPGVPALLGRVDSAYIYSQNNALVSGVSYNKRTLLLPVIAMPGDTTASVTGGQTPWVSGVSTSTFTSGIAAAQNPRCSEADKSLVGITGAPGDYREIGLFTTLTSGLRLVDINYWNP